jgi:hypothetical protein
MARARREIEAEERRDPRAQSVTAALFSDPWLADAVVDRLRDDIRVVNERGGERYLPKGTFTKTRLLEPHDLAALALCAFSLEDGNRVLDGERGAHDLDGLSGSLRRLGLAGLITATEQGPWQWGIAWGKRALAIAHEAGVERRT